MPMPRKMSTTRRNASGKVIGSMPQGTHDPFISAIGAMSNERPSPWASQICTLVAHSVIDASSSPAAIRAEDAKISRLATGVASALQTDSRM